MEKDPAKAVKWWIKSAEQGYVSAAYHLGEYYYNYDRLEAAKWYRMAAEHGNRSARIKLEFLEHDLYETR